MFALNHGDNLEYFPISYYGGTNSRGRPRWTRKNVEVDEEELKKNNKKSKKMYLLGHNQSNSKDDSSEKPNMRAIKDNSKKFKTNVQPIPHSLAKDFDMNQLVEEDQSNVYDITLDELLKQANKDNVEFKKGAIVEEHDDGDDSQNDEDE